MADLCYQCTADTFDTSIASQNDFAGLAPVGTLLSVLCEGCGRTLVDHEGKCVHLSGHPEFQPDEDEENG